MRRRYHIALALWLAGLFAAHPTIAGELTILSAGAPQKALTEAIPAFERRTGARVKIDFMPIGPLLKTIASGQPHDLVIITAETIPEAREKHWIDTASITEIGKVGVGIAIKSDAVAPDISTTEAFKATMLKARSIIQMDPERGTSGKHMIEVFTRLGILDAMKPKTTLGTGGYIVKPVGEGQIEIGIQQITEILPVPGVRLLGPLPPVLQKVTVYQGAVATKASNPLEGRMFLAFIREPAIRDIFIRTGFID